MGWIVRADDLYKEGETVSAVLEYDGPPLSEEQARWYGWGLLRGMGFSVDNVRVEAT